MERRSRRSSSDAPRRPTRGDIGDVGELGEEVRSSSPDSPFFLLELRKAAFNFRCIVRHGYVEEEEKKNWVYPQGERF
jgi:hypothetical protein